jgi:hypothetical protein
MADLEVSFPKPCNEPWDAMSPRGCNRHCAACDTVIHDLELLTLEEAERLLGSADEVCVRAKVGPDGVVALKPSSVSNRLRLVAAATASLALATAACQTVPDTAERRYQITGKFPWKDQYYQAELTSTDGRKWPGRREPGTGRFIFDHLVPGVYVLSTLGDCGTRQIVETITIDAASVDLGRTAPEPDDSCIIVGVMTPAEPRWRG